jgi:hypothetical protein
MLYVRDCYFEAVASLRTFLLRLISAQVERILQSAQKANNGPIL